MRMMRLGAHGPARAGGDLDGWLPGMASHRLDATQRSHGGGLRRCRRTGLCRHVCNRSALSRHRRYGVTRAPFRGLPEGEPWGMTRGAIHTTGQLAVRVEHVTVTDGGQAVIGPATTGGTTAAVSINAMQVAPQCDARIRRGTPCRASAMANGRCRMHGGKLRGDPPGNRHAWKHGRYSHDTIELRRGVAELVRTMRELARQFGM